MTTSDRRTVTCAVCGARCTVTPPEPANAIGSPDLDTRPPGALRALLALRVQRCAGCGHCARDLAVALPGAADGVAEDEYRALLDDASLPGPSREFLCRARLESAAGRFDDAFWSTLSAAWIADDAQDADAADRCRSLAIAALRMARAAGRRLGTGHGLEDALEVDLLRRAGEFAQAERCIRRALDRRLDEVLDQVIRFQRDLVMQRDRAAHRVVEALNPPQ